MSVPFDRCYWSVGAVIVALVLCGIGSGPAMGSAVQASRISGSTPSSAPVSPTARASGEQTAAEDFTVPLSPKGLGGLKAWYETVRSGIASDCDYEEEAKLAEEFLNIVSIGRNPAVGARYAAVLARGPRFVKGFVKNGRLNGLKASRKLPAGARINKFEPSVVYAYPKRGVVQTWEKVKVYKKGGKASYWVLKEETSWQQMVLEVGADALNFLAGDSIIDITNNFAGQFGACEIAKTFGRASKRVGLHMSVRSEPEQRFAYLRRQSWTVDRTLAIDTCHVVHYLRFSPKRLTSAQLANPEVGPQHGWEQILDITDSHCFIGPDADKPAPKPPPADDKVPTDARIWSTIDPSGSYEGKIDSVDSAGYYLKYPNVPAGSHVTATIENTGPESNERCGGAYSYIDCSVGMKMYDSQLGRLDDSWADPGSTCTLEGTFDKGGNLWLLIQANAGEIAATPIRYKVTVKVEPG